MAIINITICKKTKTNIKLLNDLCISCECCNIVLKAREGGSEITDHTYRLSSCGGVAGIH